MHPRFAVLGLPRSATTWAANWLTSGGVVCHHDPLEKHSIKQTFRLPAISCTGLWLRPDLVERLECPIVCLWREPEQVNESLRRIGMPTMPGWAVERFLATPGHWFKWKDLFTARARNIWHILRPEPFDQGRHKALVRMNVQPAEFNPDNAVMQEFVNG